MLVAGGGPVAERRTAGLLEAGADVVLVCPDAVPGLAAAAAAGELVWERRRVGPDDVRGCWLVLACTDDPTVNAELAAAAEAAGVWCSRADDAAASRVWVPARGTVGRAVVAVHGMSDPVTARKARDAAVEAVRALDPPLEQR